MRFKSKTIFAFAVLGALPFFSGCQSDSNSNQAGKAQPGAAVQDNSATVKKCDSQRIEARKAALQFLGIDVLQADSDKVLKEISPDDLKKIVKDGVEYMAKDTTEATRDDDLSEMTDIMDIATKRAGLDSGALTVIAGTNPARVLHIGTPDYIDGEGNFSLGSVILQQAKGNKVDDIYGVILGIGLNADPTKSFQSYSIGLQKITNADTDASTIIYLSDYVESQLPDFCKSTKSSLDPQTFNTLVVGSTQTN